MVEKQYMTLVEARRFLGISEYKLRALIAERGIEKVRTSQDKRWYLVSRDSIEELGREFADPANAENMRRFAHATTFPETTVTTNKTDKVRATTPPVAARRVPRTKRSGASA